MSVSCRWVHLSVTGLLEKAEKAGSLLREDSQRLHGEILALDSVGVEQLCNFFMQNVVTPEITPELLVAQLERWDLGAAARAALVIHRTPVDELRRAQLREALATASRHVVELQRQRDDSEPAVLRSRQLLALYRNLEQERGRGRLLSAPALTADNYNQWKLWPALLSPAYRRIRVQLKNFSSRHGSFFADLAHARRCLSSREQQDAELFTAKNNFDAALQALTEFEAALVVPIPDHEFVQRQVAQLSQDLMASETLPADAIAAVCAEHPSFKDVTNLCAKLQAQRVLIKAQLQQYPRLVEIASAWGEQLAPVCDALLPYAGESDLFVTIDLAALHESAEALTDTLENALTEFRQQRRVSSKLTRSSVAAAHDSLCSSATGVTLEAAVNPSAFWRRYLIHQLNDAVTGSVSLTEQTTISLAPVAAAPLNVPCVPEILAAIDALRFAPVPEPSAKARDDFSVDMFNY